LTGVKEVEPSVLQLITHCLCYFKPSWGLAYPPTLLLDWGTTAAVYRPWAWQNKLSVDLKI